METLWIEIEANDSLTKWEIRNFHKLAIVDQAKSDKNGMVRIKLSGKPEDIRNFRDAYL